VLVVANANAPGSVELAKFYAAARNILPERICVLRCTAHPEVSRDEYEKNIRQPIREYLRRHDRRGEIKCLALMWGVPVRVAGPPLGQDQRKLAAYYKAVRRREAARLAVYLKLLTTVSATFPRPRTESLRPLGGLFAPRIAATPDEVQGFGKLKALFARRLKSKHRAAAELADPTHRRIALRQLAALELHAYGLRHLAEHLPAGDIPGIPSREELTRQLARAVAELKKHPPGKETPRTAPALVELVEQIDGAVGAYEFADRRIKDIDWVHRQDAAVDNELALLWEDDYRLDGWLFNPMNWRVASAKTKPADLPRRLIMAVRIDGPSVADARRIIEDSIAAEKTGLKGKFYIDAGGPHARYEKHFTRLAELLKKRTDLPVVLDTDKQVFPPGSCPDAALYVGWYSVGKYVPAFKWTRGAVGWHVASLEAVHLRAPASNEWCVKMIQNGVAATIGPVNEPFLGAFPPPEEFFALLLTGMYSIAECYWYTTPLVSWRMTLIADPLYNPFKRFPKLSTFDLPGKMVGRKEQTRR